MLDNKIAIFGYGNHGKFIAQGLREDGFEITLIESNKDFYKDAKTDNFKHLFLIDVTKDDDLKKLKLESFEQLVCVMDDEHLNVFLTLSLRSLFSESYILSISDSFNVTKKLKMAGANKVVDLYEVSAYKIHNILKKPVATRLLESFVGNHDGIIFKEITIPEYSFLDKKMADDIDFSSYGILLMGMIDKEKGNAFIFITAGVEHKIDSGDIIVCIGLKENLDTFEKLIQKKEGSMKKQL